MRPWALPLIVLFALVTFFASVVLMPAAELLPATIQSGSWMPGLSPIRSYGLMEAFADLDKELAETFFHQPDLKTVINQPMHDGIPGEVRSYILYAVFLSIAMIAASIAINCAGRWDSEEKTIIPIKK